MPDIIIIRGAPGSGKSQTAKCLAKYFPGGVRMEVDNIRQMVISVDWKNQQEHINMLELSAKLVNDFLRFGHTPVIVVDTFSGDKVARYIKTLFQLNNNLRISLIGLYATECELKNRIEKRTSAEFNDYEICKKLNADVLKWKHENEFQVDTTELSSLQTAQVIYDRINSR